jgi:NRAMP (natural resistance-associated macrophage protein)-like metal ion transporter
MKKYSLSQAEKTFGIDARKLAYLIRKDLIEPIIEGGHLFIPETEIRRYLSLSREVKAKHEKSFLKTLGPGLITGASDDDPSGIGTYSTVGSTYGLGLTWLSLYLLPMNAAVQETVARIGIVTGEGLAGVLGKHFNRKVLYLLVTLLVIANTINIGADIGAMVASFQLLVPINFFIGAIALTLIMVIIEITFPYHRYAKVLKWLTLSLLAYILTGIIIHPNWLQVGQSLVIPKIVLDASFLAALVAVMGTTISPYLFFWQASEEVEEQNDKRELESHHRIAYRRELKEMRKDTFAGMALANVVFLFIVVTTAFVLHNNGITHINSAAEAAQALRPLAGNLAYLLFTIGIFGVGLLSVPVLAGSSAYAVCEIAGMTEGLSKKFNQAKGFYLVIAGSMVVGLAMNFLGINPILALYYAAIVNGLASPILMFFIFKIGRDKNILGEFTSPRWVNFWGYIATGLMGISAVALLIFAALGK